MDGWIWEWRRRMRMRRKRWNRLMELGFGRIIRKRLVERVDGFGIGKENVKKSREGEDVE